MIAEILTCALLLSAPAQDTVAVQADDDAFWAKKSSLRIGYETHTFQNASAGTYPVKFGVGLSRTRNVWLHKNPLGGVVRFAFDHGLDLNYSMFDTDVSLEGYDGPQGWLGTDYMEDVYMDEELPLDLSSVGMHNVSIGYALGVSVTVNPVAKLRLNGYFHFVPSASLLFSGTSLSAGFMPYCKYGAELSYNWFGVGLEWGSGMSNMADMMSKLTSESDSDSGTETPKMKYYSNYMRVYVAFRMGKNRKR